MFPAASLWLIYRTGNASVLSIFLTVTTTPTNEMYIPGQISPLFKVNETAGKESYSVVCHTLYLSYEL